MRMCNKSHSAIVFDGESCPGCTLALTADAMMKKLSECEQLQDLTEELILKCKALNSENEFLREAIGVVA